MFWSDNLIKCISVKSLHRNKMILLFTTLTPKWSYRIRMDRSLIPYKWIKFQRFRLQLKLSNYHVTSKYRKSSIKSLSPINPLSIKPPVRPRKLIKPPGCLIELLRWMKTSNIRPPSFGDSKELEITLLTYLYSS